MINKPPPLNRDQDRDPNIQAFKRRGFINQGFTLHSNLLHPENLNPAVDFM